MTKNMQSLIDDARRFEWDVYQDDHGGVRISRPHGRWKKLVGLYVCPDGTAFRLEVDASVAAGIRSYEEMRRVLGIKGRRLNRRLPNANGT